jgi:hypothetical protein
VVQSWIVYALRADRDRANKAITEEEGFQGTEPDPGRWQALVYRRFQSSKRAVGQGALLSGF